MKISLYATKRPLFIMYENLLDLNKLYKAFTESKRNVSWKASVQRYEANVLLNIYQLRKSLINGTYKQKPFYEFDINERGKLRHIKSIHISDRILQKAICNEILPVLEKYMIYDNAASRVKKGTDFSRKRLALFLTEYYKQYGNDGYVLKIDISKYFDSISHEKLVAMIGEKIKDKKAEELIGQLIDTFGGAYGLGLGAQLSQIGGIFYLHQLDNSCKIVKGIRWYVRYMDDIIIIGKDKEYLYDILSDIEHILSGLDLKLNKKKTQIIKISSGFVYLKIRYILQADGHIVKIPDKSTFLREKRKIRKLSSDILRMQFKSWHNNLLRFDCKRKLYNMRKLMAEKEKAE